MVVGADGRACKIEGYGGVDAAGHFLEAVEKERKTINEIFANPASITMSKTDESKQCWICEKTFFGDDITGTYRGAAHAYCNLRVKVEPYKTIIPVVFHNVKGYDSHFIMQVKQRKSCIANNMEKYILIKNRG